ncbi:MAG: putative LPS assembly protein LptD [Bacteroidota bacterium]|nr:putative LPS assembly protein LptD [Bacteroidota bacterium]MDP4234219.1 putative LPS assembly protein LptD [Bacteroidota bacterium]MDP4243409.1 putative LPS assembly protein LptD [Bacteroidota bacterium]MDP4288108.1 putative LPS assembly protein LptD [Bacteroidota bacterium]
MKSGVGYRILVIPVVMSAILLIPFLVRAQTPPGTTDTSTKAPAPKQVRPGFELPDSLYISADTIRGDVDTIVRYTAKDSTTFDVARKTMTLVSNAVVQFQNRELDAHTIVMDFQHNTLTAYSADVDSVVSASLALRRRIIRDTNRTKSRGAPKLTEGPTTYEGEVIVYNFKTKHGTVQLGTTELEGGFYYGEKIKQVAPQTLFVENGRYTTCDAPVPHYYFESPKMKVVMQDQIFAEPVYLYVADVPIFALPFGVFPNHGGGRHSGIIAPNYQVTGDRGYGLTHLGYYWVFNDYLDAAAQTDLYTKGGYNIDVRGEWMKKYLLNSPASLRLGYGFTRFNSVDPYTKNWLVQSSLPNLILGYETALSANLSFQSDGYFQDNARNQRDFYTQNVSSNASFNTGWSDLGMNLGIDYNRNQDLNNSTYDETSPSLNFSKSTWYPFASTEGETVDPTLSSLGIGYSLNADRQVSRHIGGNVPLPTDTSHWFTSEHYGVLHNPSIGISPKFGHFTVNPSFSYSEAWMFKQHHRIYGTQITYDSLTGKNDTAIIFTQDTTSGFNRLYNYNMGIGVSTTLYGIANIGAFGIQAIRHTVQPSISFSYHPDLSSQNYVAYIDPQTGQLQHYNIYEGELNGGLVGIGKNATLGMSLGNNFEAKVERNVTKDSTTIDHLQLLNLNASSGYNLATKILSPFSISTSSSIGTFLSMSGTVSYSFYPVNSYGQDSTDATLISLHQGYLRPTNASFGLSGSFSSATTVEGDNYDSLRRLFNITSPDDERALMLGGYFPGPFISVPFRPKWNVNYGLTYSQSYTANLVGNSIISTLQRNFGATTSLSLTLTKNWQFTTTASYDLTEGKIIIPELRIHRDLHCWEMDFSYRPPGSRISGFNLEIRIKAPQLQDVKLTRTESTYGQF